MQKIKSWHDVWDHPYYTNDVDPESVGIAEFIWHYDFEAPFHPCGIVGATSHTETPFDSPFGWNRHQRMKKLFDTEMKKKHSHPDVQG